jgi:TRAP transporter TAXI family solute receptor
MEMKLQKTLIAAAIAACAAPLTVPAHAQQVTFMTGPQGGSWIPLGGALKGMWEKAVPGLSITQTPGAGIANVRGVDEGKAQIGLANSNTTVDGIEGRAPYPKKVTKVCQLANLYPQYFQVVALADAKIDSYADVGCDWPGRRHNGLETRSAPCGSTRGASSPRGSRRSARRAR